MSDQDREDVDWATARAAYEAGASLRGASAAAGGRITANRIRRRAQAEGWVQGDVPATATLEERRARTAAAREATRRKWVDERDRVIDRMVTTMDRLLDEVHAPYVRREAKVVPQGDGFSRVEVVDVDLDSPPPADKKNLVTAVAILVDKAQLLTGEATARTETGPIGDRQAAEERLKHVRDQLAERRAAQEAAGREAAGQ